MDTGPDKKASQITDSFVFSPGDREQLKLLQRIWKRTDTIVSPTSVPLGRETIPTELIIAVLTPTLKGSNLDAVGAEFAGPPSGNEQSEYRLFHPTDDAVNQLRSCIMDHMAMAASEHVNYVCINEMYYPTCVGGADSENEKFADSVKQLAVRHGMYVVAGSYHCSKTLYNLSPLFHSGVPKEAGNPILHAKKTSAHSIKERIRIPYNREIRRYGTEFVGFAILICLDCFDASLVMRIIRMNHPRDNHRKAHLIFVPSYTTRSQDFVDACQDLSIAGASIVVYANCYKYEPNKQVFVCGTPVPEAQRTVVDESMTIYRVPWDDYNSRVIETTSNFSYAFNLMLGYENMAIYSV